MAPKPPVSTKASGIEPKWKRKRNIIAEKAKVIYMLNKRTFPAFSSSKRCGNFQGLIFVIIFKNCGVNISFGRHACHVTKPELDPHWDTLKRK